MTLVEFLEALTARGIILVLRGTDIACWYPDGSNLPSKVRQSVQFWRPELLELLLENELRSRLKPCVTADQWQAFEERARSLASAQNLPRTWAEVLAALGEALLTDANAELLGFGEARS